MDYRVLDHSKLEITQVEAKAAADAAIPSSTTLHLDPSRYKGGVDAFDEKLRVGLVDQDAMVGSALGNPGKRPAIQVTLDPNTLKVISVGPMRWCGVIEPEAACVPTPRADLDTIYVRLIDEAVDIWRPVSANRISEFIYRIEEVDVDPEIEQWEFAPGSLVRVEAQDKSGGTVLVATGLEPP